MLTTARVGKTEARPLPSLQGRLSVIVLAITLVGFSSSAAFAFDPLVGIAIDGAAAKGDTDGALKLVDDALATSGDDVRAGEDLLKRRAELLESADKSAEAAATWDRLAAMIVQQSGQTAPDLITVLDREAAAYEKAGQHEQAIGILTRLLQIIRDAGLKDQAQAYVDRLQAIKDQATDPKIAEKAQSAIDDHVAAAEDEDSRAFDVDPEKGYTTVKIYYATDRKRTGDAAPENFYGGDRNDRLEMGTATVSIPPHHRPGQIEKPSIWTLEFHEDPEKHIVFSGIHPDDPDKVFDAMRQQVKDTGSNEAFVFVHGFNVPFSDAVERTAQMAYDMNFSGIPILYSWPSAGSMLSYISDEAVVDLSGRRLSRFLDDVVAKSGATRIHLIAHSMGNRALTDALELYALRHQGQPPAFDQVLFTAPDVDAGLFSDMLQTIRPAAKHITLYASDKDWALAVSRRIHGDAPRAGQGGKGILELANVDSIDMTEIGDDMLKHSYYANNPSALSDILALFWRDAAPAQRCGMTKETGTNGGYWFYEPAQCDSGALLSTLSFLRKGGIQSLVQATSFMNHFIMPATADSAERSRLQGALAKLFGSSR